MKKNITKIIIVFFIALFSLGLIQKAGAVVVNAAEAKALFAQAKDNFLNTVQAYKTAKQTLLNIKTQLRNASTSDQLINASRDFLKSKISAMIKYLEAMKNKVANMRNINEDDRTAILASLEDNITWLKGKQQEANGASIDQLKTINQAVQDKWLMIHLTAKRLTGQMLAARIKFLIDKANAMIINMEAKIAELKQSGNNDTAVSAEKALATFKDKISQAQDKYNQAKAKFQEAANATSKDQINSLIQQGRQLVNEANQILKQANRNLSEVVRNVKKVDKSNQPGNATSTE